MKPQSRVLSTVLQTSKPKVDKQKHVTASFVNSVFRSGELAIIYLMNR
jgi:hypothetical protein